MDKKVKVKVFLPVGVCSCSLTGFLGNIYEAVKKHRDYVEYSEDTIISRAAQDMGIKSKGVLIGSKFLEGNVSTAKIENTILAELSGAT